jgi:transcriptional regulator with XRE-family HTH domain
MRRPDDDIAKRLIAQRTLRGWTPGDLAHRAGLTAFAVRQLEQGKRAPLT